MRLPVVVVTEGGATCFSCPAPCCSSYLVPLTGFDVWRLVRGLQLPWREVAEVRASLARSSFAIDDSDARLGLFLPAHHGEVCRFLLQLPNQQQRCGVHSSRPLACRVYPWAPDGGSQLGVQIMAHAMCPPPQRAHFDSQRGEAHHAIAVELAEWPLYDFLVSRWNDEVAKRRQRSTTPDEFVAWVLALYDALLPLRGGADWSHAALELINDFPLP